MEMLQTLHQTRQNTDQIFDAPMPRKQIGHPGMQFSMPLFLA